MVPLVDLWLPILLAAVFVFVASSVVHMALPWHRGDYRGLKNEDAVLDSLRSAGVEPGEYMFPFCASMKDLDSEAMKRKLSQGPIGSLNVRPPGGWKMGPSLLAWFVYSLVIATFAGYLTRLAVEPGADYAAVHRVAGAAGVLGFAFWHVPVSIWKGVSWGTTLRFVADGVLYGLIVGGTFGWLWPAAA